MSAYLAARLRVKEKDKLVEYSKKAAPMIEKFGGKLLFKGGVDDIIVGELKHMNLAVFEFPNKEEIMRFYSSAEYIKIIPIRDEGADMVLSIHETI